jgi:hypothetical protein
MCAGIRIMIINDTEFNKKFTATQEGDAIFIHRKNCGYWRISEEGGIHRLVAWGRNYKYDVYFDNFDNLISFITN